MASNTDIPLCVDLDGTLFRQDTLVRALLNLARRDWLSLLQTPLWLTRGKAYFKARIFEVSRLDPDSLTPHAELLDFLRAEREAGRPLWLVSGSDQRQVKALAQRLDLFCGVQASDGKTNLVAEAKAARLTQLFGEGDFDYVGNSHQDLPCWRAARKSYAVNPPDELLRQITADETIRLERVFGKFPRRAQPCPIPCALRLTYDMSAATTATVLRRTLRSLSLPENDAHQAEAFIELIAAQKAELPLPVLLGFTVLELGLSWMTLFSHGRRFQHLAADAREEVLEQWENSRLGPLRDYVRFHLSFATLSALEPQPSPTTA